MTLKEFLDGIVTLPAALIAIAVLLGSTNIIARLSPEKEIQKSLGTVPYFRAGRTFGYEPQQLYAMLDVFNQKPDEEAQGEAKEEANKETKKEMDGEALRNAYLKFFSYDFIYPLIYGFSMALIIAYLQKKWNTEGSGNGLEAIRGHYLWALPLVAMVFDYAENISLIHVIKNYRGEPMPGWVGFSRWMTMFKLVLVYASYLLCSWLVLLLVRDLWKCLSKMMGAKQPG
ncbi:MAG TPA: hypothetical protein VF779_00450 [Pyrinomonadaceae bacterium]